jgi:hypothetical protein
LGSPATTYNTAFFGPYEGTSKTFSGQGAGPVYLSFMPPPWRPLGARQPIRTSFLADVYFSRNRHKNPVNKNRHKKFLKILFWSSSIPRCVRGASAGKLKRGLSPDPNQPLPPIVEKLRTRISGNRTASLFLTKELGHLLSKPAY